MAKQYEAQTPEEALPAWVLVKRQIVGRLYLTQDDLQVYRKRNNSRNLKRLANSILDLYLLVKPKLKKINHGKQFIKDFNGIEEQLGTITETDAKVWLKWLGTCIEAIEEMGVTKITMPSSRVGAELVEGTLMAGLVDK